MERKEDFAKFNLNNEEITISYWSLLNKDILFASNSKKQKIAKCDFEIIKFFERPLSFVEQQQIMAFGSLSQEEPPQTLYVGNKLKLVYGDRVNKNEFVLLDKTYTLKSTFCRLNFITLLNENYYKKGVGSALIKTLESLAISRGCDYIRGLYSPAEPFPNGAKKFYERNGYEIRHIPPCLTPCVVKNLNKEKPLDL